MTKPKKVHRFMATVDDDNYVPLVKEAEAKYPGAIGAVQKLIRFNVIPDWLKEHPDGKQLLTKIVAQRIDNGWVITESGKEADGSTYKHIRSEKNEKAILAVVRKALEIDQTRLDAQPEDET